jgi:steroid delta-isomerase-like uncharacterized protein
MSENENKQLLRRYYEDVLTQGRLDVLETIARPDHIEHNPFPGQAQGMEGLRQRVNTLRAAFNPQFTLEHMIAEGDKVAVMWTSRGTHVGEWFGLPATGKSFTIQGVDVHLLRDGRMAEHWDVVDIYSLLIQLGALPAPSGAPA